MGRGSWLGFALLASAVAGGCSLLAPSDDYLLGGGAKKDAGTPTGGTGGTTDSGVGGSGGTGGGCSVGDCDGDG